jgi:hypothetical protein
MRIRLERNLLFPFASSVRAHEWTIFSALLKKSKSVSVRDWILVAFPSLRCSVRMAVFFFVGRINFYLWGLGEIGKSFGDARARESERELFSPQLPLPADTIQKDAAADGEASERAHSSSKNRVIQVREQ